MQNQEQNQMKCPAYIGTKIVCAIPMSEINFLKTVKKMTDDELRNRESAGDGYLVIYEDGYKSWSPKAVFERCYRLVTDQEKRII